MAIEPDVFLPGDAGRFRQRLAFRNQDLGADDVDAGHLLGDGVFDLHTGVHLDEVEASGLHIHQEFDGAGAFIADMSADAPAQFADFGALLRV